MSKMSVSCVVTSKTKAAVGKTKKRIKENRRKYAIARPAFVWSHLADLKVEAVGADVDNDILLKVTTCGLSFDFPETSVSLHRGKAWLPACPLADEPRHWPLDQKGQYEPLPGDGRTDQATARHQNFLLESLSQSLDGVSCGGHDGIDVEPIKGTGRMGKLIFWSGHQEKQLEFNQH